VRGIDERFGGLRFKDFKESLELCPIPNRVLNPVRVGKNSSLTYWILPRISFQFSVFSYQFLVFSRKKELKTDN
jgi:hypothetical protein